MQIAYIASDEVKAAIVRIGRTEDARFSPNGRRLAIPGLYVHHLLVLELEWTRKQIRQRSP